MSSDHTVFKLLVARDQIFQRHNKQLCSVQVSVSIVLIKQKFQTVTRLTIAYDTIDPG